MDLFPKGFYIIDPKFGITVCVLTHMQVKTHTPVPNLPDDIALCIGVVEQSCFSGVFGVILEVDFWIDPEVPPKKISIQKFDFRIEMGPKSMSHR